VTSAFEGSLMGASDEAPIIEATAQQHRKPGGLRRRDRLVGLASVLPAFLVVVGFMAFPVAFAVFISFTRTNGLTFEWNSFANYTALLTDPVVHQVFLNNLKFLISVPLVIFVALIVSVLLFERVRGWRFFRLIFFLPNVLSVAVIGIMFRNAFGYYGGVNQALALFGLEPVQFFTDGTLAISVIILALVWSGFGYQSLLLLAGLTSINPAVFEAAAIDGAGWWKRLWYITLPNIRRVLGFVFIINVLYTFTSLFGFVFVMTAGGPGFDTTTIDYLVYLRAFSSSNLGSGAALAVVLFLFIGVLTLIQNRVFRLQEED
jgi:multiple sugar transport system permease protein